METTIGQSTALSGADAVPLAWALTVIHHPDPEHLGKRTPITAAAPTLLGRGSDAFGPGVLAGERISRRHAEVTVDGAIGARIRDLDSRNGTRVNGETIGERALAEWDRVELGDVVLIAHRTPAVYRVTRHPHILGVSPQICRVIEEVAHVAGRPTPVLVAGEAGTGRSLVATAIHDARGRSGPVRTVDCADLGVGELLGRDDSAGLIETTAGGTLILDHVDAAAADTQLALLRFLEDGRVRRLGTADTRAVDCQIIATSHRRPNQLPALRPELAGRVGRWTIVLPPLAQRRQDLPILAAALARRAAGRPLPLHRRLVGELLARDWPGNVRELADDMARRVAAAGDDADSLDSERPRLRLARDGSWFELDGARVDLAGRRAPRRLLVTLVEHAPAALSVAELLEAGWPGEKVVESAGANRVYVALTGLRKLGLRDVVERTDDGYRIAPGVSVERL